jgi:Holliday junction resolvase YEN1
MYRSSAIVKQWTDKDGTSLKTEEDCRMAMVWIALLGGGDYAPEGLTGFGKLTTKRNLFKLINRSDHHLRPC